MSSNVFPDMARYFQSIVGQLTNEARQAGLLQNPTAIGTGREEIYRRILERHLPSTCEVFRGGYVFNVQGNRSKQIDVIATSGLAPRFEMVPNQQAIAPLEGTIAVAEVKSKLNGRELRRALCNFASLPTIVAPGNALTPQIKVGPEFWWDWPYKVIFAYDGIDKKLIEKHRSEFYQENRDIPQECRPSLIHVLGKYIFVRITPQMTVSNADGSQPSNPTPVGQYRLFETVADVSAMAFMFMALQQRSFIANHMLWKYDELINPLIDGIRNNPQ